MFELSEDGLSENGLDENVINSIDDFIRANRYRLMRSVLIIKNQKMILSILVGMFSSIGLLSMLPELMCHSTAAS